MIDEHGKGRPLLRPVSRVAGKRDGGLTCPWSQPASATPAWAITATSSVDAAARPKGRRPTFRRFLILTPHPSPNMAAASSNNGAGGNEERRHYALGALRSDLVTFTATMKEATRPH